MVKLAPLLIDRAAGGFDDATFRAELKQRVPELWQPVLCRAPSDDAPWHAEQQPNEMGVVHMQVEHWPTNLFGRPEVLEPLRIGNHATKAAADECPVASAAGYFQRPGIFGEVGQDMTNE